MVQKILITITILSLSACGMFGNKPSSGGGSNSSSGNGSMGVFHPGPYTDEATGKTCNAPGGYCESDMQCHSSAAKCK